MENQLCGTCHNKNISYCLVNADNIICPHCKYLKYKKNSIKLNLCDIECSALYWWMVEEISDDPENIKVSYCLEKNECIKCGKKDFPEELFVGKFIGTIQYCELCDERARYELSNTDDIICSHCNSQKYEKHDHKMILCSTQCPKLLWKNIEYLSPKNSNDVSLIYCVPKDKCNECGKRETINVTFNGKYIGKLKNGKRVPLKKPYHKH